MSGAVDMRRSNMASAASRVGWSVEIRNVLAPSSPLTSTAYRFGSAMMTGSPASAPVSMVATGVGCFNVGWSRLSTTPVGGHEAAVHGDQQHGRGAWWMVDRVAASWYGSAQAISARTAVT